MSNTINNQPVTETKSKVLFHTCDICLDSYTIIDSLVKLIISVKNSDIDFNHVYSVDVDVLDYTIHNIYDVIVNMLNETYQTLVNVDVVYDYEGSISYDNIVSIIASRLLSTGRYVSDSLI